MGRDCDRIYIIYGAMGRRQIWTAMNKREIIYIGDGLGGHRINTNMTWGKVGRTEREYMRETLRGEHSGKRVAVLRKERIDHETLFCK